MRYRELIDALTADIREQVECIVEDAIHTAMNRNAELASNDGVLSVCCLANPGHVTILFEDGLLASQGWCKNDHDREAPALTLDPLWIARDIDAQVVADPMSCGDVGWLAGVSALEQRLRTAADMLRGTRERVWCVADSREVDKEHVAI